MARAATATKRKVGRPAKKKSNRGRPAGSTNRPVKERLGKFGDLYESIVAARRAKKKTAKASSTAPKKRGRPAKATSAAPKRGRGRPRTKPVEKRNKSGFTKAQMIERKELRAAFKNGTVVRSRGRHAKHLRDIALEFDAKAKAKKLSGETRGRKAGGKNRSLREKLAARKAARQERRAKKQSYAKLATKPRGRKPGVRGGVKFPASAFVGIKRGRGRPKGAKDKAPRKRRNSAGASFGHQVGGAGMVKPRTVPARGLTTTPKLAKKAQAPTVKVASTTKRASNVRAVVHRTPMTKVGSIKATGRGTLRSSRA